jgi:hypothetical protein
MRSATRASRLNPKQCCMHGWLGQQELPAVSEVGSAAMKLIAIRVSESFAMHGLMSMVLRCPARSLLCICKAVQLVQVHTGRSVPAGPYLLWIQQELQSVSEVGYTAMNLDCYMQQ